MFWLDAVTQIESNAPVVLISDDADFRDCC